MNAKAKGTRNEHRSIRLHEAAGYACTRAAASLGAWDIIGVGSTDIVLCQVKTCDWPGAVQMEALKAFPAPANCRKLLHRWLDRQRPPDIREVNALDETDLTKARALLRSGDYAKVQVAGKLEVSRHTLWRALARETAR